MAAADTAAKAASGAFGAVTKVAGWGLNQLHPFGEKGKLGRTLALGATTILAGGALTLLAPTAAFAGAASGLPPIPGMMDYAGAGAEIAWAGGEVAWNIVSAVGATLPETTTTAIETAQQAALDAN